MDQTSLPLPHKPARAGRPEDAGFGVSPMRKRREQAPATNNRGSDESRLFCCGSRGSRTPDPLLVRQTL